ncbi:MAG: hypothetical protein WD051_14020 [Steroidobacteraceae bacterium]
MTTRPSDRAAFKQTIEAHFLEIENVMRTCRQMLAHPDVLIDSNRADYARRALWLVNDLRSELAVRKI